MDFFSRSIIFTGVELTVFVSILFMLLIWVVINSLKIKKLNKRYTKFMKTLNPAGDIEETMSRFLERVEQVYQTGIEVQNSCNEMEKKQRKMFQKIGVVRYNAFENVGSDLSFTVALLDGNDDGFVLNGVYSREGTCTYAKPITNGESKHALSVEERCAVDSARKTYL